MTHLEWQRLFRMVQNLDGLVSVDSDDWYDAKVEKVGRKRVTLVQQWDTGNDMNPCVDRYGTFDYDDLQNVCIDVDQWDGTSSKGSAA
jgi:hypothetical protein